MDLWKQQFDRLGCLWFDAKTTLNQYIYTDYEYIDW